MTICAVVSGCDCWWQIADFCRVKAEWFKERLGLKLEHGVASHDTFQRVFALLDPKEFEKHFIRWVKAVCKIDREIVNIDGKTICGSRNGDNPPLHLVSAWANKNRLVLGQKAVHEKSNEITAIPELLDILELNGCIITIDAMGAQKEIAAKIISNKGKSNDYVLALKGNQGKTHTDVFTCFEETLQDEKLYFDKNRLKTAEKSHGRIEKRAYYLSDDIAWLDSKGEWPGLKAIGAVWSETERNGKIVTEHRYYLTTLTDIKLFAESVKAHWGIENSLHWCLDVSFNEDKSIIRTGNTIENFAVIRRIALNLLTHYQPPDIKEKMSVKAKRKKCEYDCNFMADVLLSTI
jgi:predicted transposase YbfD/YdcC